MARNKFLKMPGTLTEYTPALVQELIRCTSDPVHFVEAYCKVVHPTKGLVPFKLYDFQKEMVESFAFNRNTILCSARQSGKSQVSCAFLLWYCMFHPDSTILIVSNKAAGAKEMVHRIVTSYEHLPDWLRPAINPNDWNKLSISFDNGSKIISEATTENSGRGLSISLFFGDETSFWAPAIAEAMWASLSPVLATGGKCILASTPNGDDNLYADLWRGAEGGKNGFNRIFVPWNVVPGRDEKFKEEEIAKISLQKWLQEYECLHGDTLVDIINDTGIEQTITLKHLSYITPFKIKTPYGWETFDGVKKMGTKQTYKLTFNDGSYIKATDTHRFFINNNTIEVNDITIGDVLDGITEKRVVSITDDVIVDVYDVINTESHTFYANGLVSHNCEFISSDPLLINSQFVTNYELEYQPNADAHNIVWFDTIQRGKSYVLAIDPATGSGSDYTVMELYSFPELKQVAEFRDNSTHTPNIYNTLKHLLKFIQSQGAETCYWSFENNGIGEGIISMYESDDKPVEFGDLISEEGKRRIGFSTTKSKMRTCITLKTMFEGGKLKIRSAVVISELKNFVRRNGSYAARNGSTDDTVSAHLILIRIVEEIVQYEDNAYALMYEDTQYDEEHYDEPPPIVTSNSWSNDELLHYSFASLF